MNASANIQNPKRVGSFSRNIDLEDLLNELEILLKPAETEILKSIPIKQEFPLLFIVGPHRSGSTLFMQWLASTGQFAYPTNLLSRFYYAPIIGAKIQQLLTDEKYNFRNEILDFNHSIDFYSENGKTKGALSPNEFWYFWRKFLPFKELDYLPDDELNSIIGIDTMKAEFNGLMDVFQKPFALKAMILNYNIPFLNKLFDKCIFVYTKRDPLTNIESALNARERQLESINEWYSFKIPEYPELIKISDPIEQTARQIFCINRAVEKGLETVEVHKKIVVPYEEFCKFPGEFYYKIADKLLANGYKVESNYCGVDRFNVSRKFVNNLKVEYAYHKIVKENVH